MKEVSLITNRIYCFDSYCFQREVLTKTLLILLILLLNACSMPTIKLTNGHIEELKNDFIGREFVFRTDWHTKMVIYKGKPVHFYDTYHHKTHLIKTELQKIGEFKAHSGDTAVITDAWNWSYRTLGIHFTTDNNVSGVLYIMAPNKEIIGSEFWEDLTDQTTTASWVEDQLTSATVKFLDSPAKGTGTTHATLPEPPKQPKLTPVSTVAVPQTPVKATISSISQLHIQANPPEVKHDEVLKLLLNYTIDAVDQETVKISESRSLLFDGKVLPNYPQVKHKNLGSGDYTTTFKQKIPPQAKPGNYTYKGEVCLESGCINRRVKFSILP